MDQFDLFTTDHTPAAEVDVTSTRVDTPPAQTPTPAPSTATGLPNILLFATQHQREMWSSFKHRRDCMMMVTGFASFRDFGMKPINEITQRDIIDYRTYSMSMGRTTVRVGMGPPFSKGTINRHLSAISACFRHAVFLQLIDDRPQSCLFKEEEAEHSCVHAGDHRPAGQALRRRMVISGWPTWLSWRLRPVCVRARLCRCIWTA